MLPSLKSRKIHRLLSEVNIFNDFATSIVQSSKLFFYVRCIQQEYPLIWPQTITMNHPELRLRLETLIHYEETV